MIRQTAHGFWIISGDTHIGAWCEQHGRLDHDQNALPHILRFIKEGDFVIDAGAYVGDHTTAYLKKVGPMGIVLAFEPNREAFDCLNRNCPQANCIRCQLGLSNVQERAHLVRPHPTNHGACMAFVDGDRMHDGPDERAQFMALDDFGLGRVDFIKADVEGGEYDLLLGATETIERCRPILLVEVNEAALAAHGRTPKALLELIVNLGYYSITNIYPRQECAGPQWDALCLPRKK